MEKEFIVYVDEDGRPTGEIAPKLEAHTDETRLHLAFSCYIFNDRGQILVTQRAHGKKVWPNVWTNSVCGHPAPDESFEDAIKRRAKYEIGMSVSDIVSILSDYSYKTPPYNGIIENEFCPVFLATTVDQPILNYDEVDGYMWLEWDEFVKCASSDKDNVWSFWCKDQISRFDQEKIKNYINKIRQS